MKRIVVCGALGQRPGRGGHAWALAQYPLGFQELGWDVLFLDRAATSSLATHGEAAWLARVMDPLRCRWAMIDAPPHEQGGLTRREVLRDVAAADALVNVMGYLDDEEVLAAAPMRIYLDIDPGFPQMWRALGFADPFAGHDAFVTVGENVGSGECTIPMCDLEWITTPQPIALSHWNPLPPSDGPLTSVGSWRGPYGPVDYEGTTYGLRVHQFRRFIDLPQRLNWDCELALDIDDSDRRDREALLEAGWHLVNPLDVAGDPWRYRDYVQRSGGEFMVAKDMYVRSRSGWFSDRSICYLASGRPVLAQDTGVGDHASITEGLITFSTLDEAVAGAERFAAEPRRHALAARRIAEERFDARVVLPRLLERLGVA